MRAATVRYSVLSSSKQQKSDLHLEVHRSSGVSTTGINLKVSTFVIYIQSAYI